MHSGKPQAHGEDFYKMSLFRPVFKTLKSKSHYAAEPGCSDGLNIGLSSFNQSFNGKTHAHFHHSAV